MKTHELSKALSHLSRVLRAGPNIDLEDLTNLTTYASSSSSRAPRSSRDAEKREILEKGTGLALLAQMASYNKQELLELTELLGIPVQVRSADAVRDVLGKILKYIQENPNVRDRLVNNVSTDQPAKTSALAHALAILMKQP